MLSNSLHNLFTNHCFSWDFGTLQCYSSTTLYGASSIQHQKENVNQSEPEHYTSLADTKRMERQRPITSENNSTNKNKDFGETTSPPNYKASSGFPNMDGVNIPIDLDALLDSLVIPWDPPDNDIDDIMKGLRRLFCNFSKVLLIVFFLFMGAFFILYSIYSRWN